jgi:hypothetical protein
MPMLRSTVQGTAVSSSSHVPQPLAFDPGAGKRGQALWVAGLTLLTHLLILVYDHATAFRAFTWGDRGMERLRILKGFAGLEGAVLPAMTGSPIVPGEYLFVLLPWRLGGPMAIICFQIALATLAAWLVARLAGRVSSWPRAPLVCGLVYAFLPQNLAFPHQLVTEAIVTPLCVAWLYAMLTAIRDRAMGLFLLAGLCLGAAILTRPVALLMLPVPFALALACPGARPEMRRPGLYAMAGVALVPFLVWVAIFTAQVGHVGYNTGSANLAWNLRSKVLITESANGIDPPADVRAMDAGIPIGRFLAEVRAHPVPFAKAFVLDTATVFLRGNTTKITVDYLGIDRDPQGWRQPLLYARDAREQRIRQMLRPVFLLEEVGSLVTGLFFIVCVWRMAVMGTRLMRGEGRPDTDRLFLTIVAAAWLFNVFLSAQMVDQSQGRLRNPAEAALILFVAMAVCQKGRRYTSPSPQLHDPSGDGVAGSVDVR